MRLICLWLCLCTSNAAFVSPPHGTVGSMMRRACVHMQEDKGGGAPSFEAFKKMMEKTVDPNNPSMDAEQERKRGEELSIGEKVQRGLGSSWANPAYWNRQFVSASHIANNVPNGSSVLELGKDAKNLYYLNSPGSATLVIPPSNVKVEEGPIREAAAKLGVPFALYTERALDDLPIKPMSFDAALCFDMLADAPQEVAAGAVVLLSRSLKVGGRLLFVERSDVGMPQLAREYGDCTVTFETEGGFDVGIATRRAASAKPKRKAVEKAAKAKKGPPPPATTAGFAAPPPSQGRRRLSRRRPRRRRRQRGRRLPRPRRLSLRKSAPALRQRRRQRRRRRRRRGRLRRRSGRGRPKPRRGRRRRRKRRRPRPRRRRSRLRRSRRRRRPRPRRRRSRRRRQRLLLNRQRSSRLPPMRRLLLRRRRLPRRPLPRRPLPRRPLPRRLPPMQLLPRRPPPRLPLLSRPLQPRPRPRRCRRLLRPCPRRRSKVRCAG